MNNQTKENINISVLSDLGENYHYIKTIINNKKEVFRLELLQHISKLGNLIILAVIALFFMMVIIALIAAALVVYLAQVYNSYLYGILVAIGILMIVALVMFALLKPKITRLVEGKLLSIMYNENQK